MNANTLCNIISKKKDLSQWLNCLIDLEMDLRSDIEELTDQYRGGTIDSFIYMDRMCALNHQYTLSRSGIIREINNVFEIAGLSVEIV